MKIKLDENIPTALIDDLSHLNHEVQSVHQEGMQGFSDYNLWNKVQSEKRFFITQDLDFSDTNKFQPGTHFGILLVRLREPGRLKLRQKIKELFELKYSNENWEGSFLVLTDHKLRKQHPSS